ncbi:MAG TPA: Crp/Fnr family transcriptional regulator [Solirubrobacteraceae bacterium]|nr:Crp/Fnr family transcriptional regulator [Solirubrobacteraceae bacterium]
MAIPGPCVLFDLLPELGSDLQAGDCEQARRALVAPTLALDPGPWDPRTVDLRPTLGALVCGGLLTRTIALNGRTTTELLGPADILRPWDEENDGGPVHFSISWMVHEPTRLAFLDRRVAMAVARWPEVAGALSRRAVARSHSLAVQLACAHMPRLDERVLVLLWHLATRWGHVGPHGTVLPLRLTHRTLAELAGARRPSVTAALGDLTRRDLIARAPEGWVLKGDPSAPLAGLDGDGPQPLAQATTNAAGGVPSTVTGSASAHHSVASRP